MGDPNINMSGQSFYPSGGEAETPAHQRYMRIDPNGDTLSGKYFYDTETNQVVMVNPDGTYSRTGFLTAKDLKEYMPPENLSPEQQYVYNMLGEGQPDRPPPAPRPSEPDAIIEVPKGGYSGYKTKAQLKAEAKAQKKEAEAKLPWYDKLENGLSSEFKKVGRGIEGGLVKVEQGISKEVKKGANLVAGTVDKAIGRLEAEIQRGEAFIIEEIHKGENFIADEFHQGEAWFREKAYPRDNTFDPHLIIITIAAILTGISTYLGGAGAFQSIMAGLADGGIMYLVLQFIPNSLFSGIDPKYVSYLKSIIAAFASCLIANIMGLQFQLNWRFFRDVIVTSFINIFAVYAGTDIEWLVSWIPFINTSTKEEVLLGVTTVIVILGFLAIKLAPYLKLIPI